MAAQQVEICQVGAVANIGSENLDFPEIIEKIPDQWKASAAELIVNATTVFCKLRQYNKSLKNFDKLENVISSTTPPDPKSVTSILEKLPCTKGIKNFIMSYCTSAQSCDAIDYETYWQTAQREIQQKINLEKIEAANSCVKSQLITSAVIILIECEAIYATFADIEHAENVIKECKEVDIPLIRNRIKEILDKQIQLRLLIDEYLITNSIEKRFMLMSRSTTLNGELNEVKGLILSIKLNIDGEIMRIGTDAKDQLRRGFTNSFQSIGNAFHYYSLAENLSTPFKIAQAGLIGLFGTLALVNTRNYIICQAKLQELRDIQPLIREMEGFVRQAHEAIQEGEELLFKNF